MTSIPTSPHIEGLLDLACRNGVDVRQTLLRVLTDLYVQKPSHTAEEESQYVELSGRLIENADTHTRAAVAARLAAYGRAPSAVLERLGQTAIEAPVNETTPADAPSPEPDLAELFFAADNYERRLILINLDAGLAPGRSRAVPGGVEICRGLEAAILAHNLNEFARILQNGLGLRSTIAERIANDSSGESIVVAAKALAMPPAMLQRILLFINPAIGQSVERVYELAGLYDEMSFAAADVMVAIWRDEQKKRRPAYQSSLYDDEKRPARSAMSTARYRSARRSDALAARFKNSGR